MLVSRRIFQRGRLALVPAVLFILCLLGSRRIFGDSRVESRTRFLTKPANKEASFILEAAGAQPGKEVCPTEISRLRDSDYDLTESIRYSRRCVRPRLGKSSSAHATLRREVTNLPGPLIPETATVVDLTRCSARGDNATTSLPASVVLPDCEPLDLPVTQPYPRPASYPHLLFGVSSTYSRLERALDGFAHWLAGTSVQLVAIVHDADWIDTADGNGRGKHDLNALEMAYRARTVNLHALAPQNRSRTVIQNHFAVLDALLAAVTPQTTRWLGILDDDTFFPSLYKLDRTLQLYDHSKPAWLGALSEDFDAIATWGYMAYGGAGVFLSVPLAEQLAPHIGACLDNTPLLATETIALKAAAAKLEAVPAASSTKPTGLAAGTATGDGILRDCIYQHTNTKLTVVPGLYQHDMYGDLSGFYESGVLPLSVHHWRSWYKEPLPKMAAVTRVCGDCFLQRWQFGTDTVLTNGYSVAKYSNAKNGGGTGSGVAAYDLAQMEATWSHPGREFDFSLGPLRRALDAGEKKSYRLKSAVATPDGGLRQTYVYKGDFVTDEMDEVFELVWNTAR